MPAGKSPCQDGDSEKLPTKIGRYNQKPGYPVSLPYFSAERSVKIGISDTAVLTEDGLSDVVDQQWHQHEADKQETGE